jgi:hypothetical protein
VGFLRVHAEEDVKSKSISDRRNHRLDIEVVDLG